MDIMTRADRETLIKIARQRERVAKSDAREHAARLLADFEKQLDRRYSYDENAIWSSATAIAREAVAKAQAAVSEECERLGIPRVFAPSLQMGWESAGRQGAKKERVEMRRVATGEIEALEKAARAAIDRRSVETQEKIMIGGLTTEDARLYLESMPTAETLMPALTMSHVETLLLAA